MTSLVLTKMQVNSLYHGVLEQLVMEPITVSPRGLATRELTGAVLRLEYAQNCVVSLKARQLNYHFMVAEWLWVATGREDVASIAPYNKKIADFSDDGEIFFGAYGPRWRDQIGYLLAKLRKDPDSRQAVISIWRPNPPSTKDVPCTVAMQYLIRDGELHTIVTMRSSDAWLGLPYDIFNFARLGSIVAGELGIEQGSLQLQLGSLHLYETNHEAVRKVLSQRTLEMPIKLAPLHGLPSVEHGDLLATGFRYKDLKPIDPHSTLLWEYIEVLQHRFNNLPLSANNPFKMVLP